MPYTSETHDGRCHRRVGRPADDRSVLHSCPAFALRLQRAEWVLTRVVYLVQSRQHLARRFVSHTRKARAVPPTGAVAIPHTVEITRSSRFKVAPVATSWIR